jgi:iron complex outermembrane receptor protein
VVHPKILKGLPGSGFGNTYENTATRNNKLMDLFLNYNSKIAAIDTQIDLTGGYSYQDFRDANDGSSFYLK